MTNTTTGSERVVPGQQPPAGERTPLLARLVRPAVTHWQFSLVVVAAIVMRIVVVLGYPPIFWFSDSYNYLQDAVTHVPDEVRPNGYPFLLDLLLPLHSYYAIGLLQAAMGVAVGVAIYALLRHRGLPWWGAALPALPVLFDAYELHLEHMVTADPLFIFLVTIAVVILCWSDRPSILTMAVGRSAHRVRDPGTVGRRAIAGRGRGGHAVPAGRLAPPLGCGRGGHRADRPLHGVVHGTWGQYALSESGAFLYSRVSTFAQCSKMNVPATLAYLCDPTKLKYRPVAGEYVWADNELKPYQYVNTPLYNAFTSDTSARFTPEASAQTEQFAKIAIEDQPMAYLRVVIDDTLHTFGWNRQPDPLDYLRKRPELPVRQRPRDEQPDTLVRHPLSHTWQPLHPAGHHHPAG